MTENEQTCLLDTALGFRHPMNAAAGAVLGQCVNDIPFDQFVIQLAERYGADPKLVRADSVDLLTHLNTHSLVQPVQYSLVQEWAYYQALLVRLLGVPIRPMPVKRRILLHSRGPLVTLRDITRGVWLAWRLPTLAVLGLAAVLATSDSSAAVFLLRATGGLLAAICVHEYCHWAVGKLMGFPCVLVVSPGGVALVRAKGKRWQDVLVGVVGPVVTLLLGLLLTRLPMSIDYRFPLVAPFVFQAITLLPMFTDSPFYPEWLRVANWIRQQYQRKERAMRKDIDFRAWFDISLRSLLSLIVGTVVSVVGLLFMAMGLGIVADASGWENFQWNLGPLHFLTFSKLENGFNTQIGDALYYLAVLVGVISALVTARRLHRQQNTTQPKSP